MWFVSGQVGAKLPPSISPAPYSILRLGGRERGWVCWLETNLGSAPEGLGHPHHLWERGWEPSSLPPVYHPGCFRRHACHHEHRYKGSAPISLASVQWDARPAHFFVSAALAAVERQRLALAARAAPTRGHTVQPAQPVAPGMYVGQVIMRSSLGIPQPISDEQYASWLEARPA